MLRHGLSKLSDAGGAVDTRAKTSRSIYISLKDSSWSFDMGDLQMGNKRVDEVN